MSEKVIVRMNTNFEVGIWAVNPNEPDSDNFEPINQIYELTPYGMMLASLADCTGQVVISYARHHDVGLQEVELKAEYERVLRMIAMLVKGSTVTTNTFKNKSVSTAIYPPKTE